MPRRLLRDGQFVDDDWRYLAEAGAEPVPALILTVDQWHAQRDSWLARRAPPCAPRLGVLLPPSHHVDVLGEDLAHLALVAAAVRGRAAGGGYSPARLRRHRHICGGHLRATGYVRRDQLFFLARCGFNSFEMPDAEFEHARAALAAFSAGYQPSNDLGLPVTLPGRASGSAAP